ncbi:MAG: PIN domain-containing protein [Cyanobacteriota bacterium]
MILQRCQQVEWQLMGSEAVIAEISQTQDLDRQARLRSLVDLATRFVQVDEGIEMRSAELIQQGFTVFDGLHLACAESGGADVFLTTDDRLHRRAARLVDVLQVRVENPVTWLLEVTADADE